ncbi:hypothetical protein BC629DRAFT_1601137, partial [Irpex lacteus]
RGDRLWFNNLPDSFPPTSTVAQPLELSKLSDIVRREWALAGFTEVLPLILCSHEENFDWLNRKDDGTQAVRIANPKTLEFQVVRTVFESSDVVFKDSKAERQARNVRHAAAVWCNKTAGFEVVHGMLDRAMQMLEVPRIASTDAKATHGYYIKEREDPTFFPGRAPQSTTAAHKSAPLSTLKAAYPSTKTRKSAFWVYSTRLSSRNSRSATRARP